MTDIDEPASDETITLDLPAEGLHTLSIKDRKLGIRIVPYDVVAEHPSYGALMFKAGAFGTVDPRTVRLRMDHQDPPTGLGSRFWEESDGAYMEFQLSKTSRADDQLTLAVDGVSRGASVGYSELAGRPTRQRIGGRLVTVYGPGSVELAELSTTWMPTFSEAGVMYALSKTGDIPVPENDAPVITPGIDYDALASVTASAIDKVLTAHKDAGADSKIETLLSKFEEMVELQRSNLSIPVAPSKPKALFKDWFGVTLRMLAGERVSDTELKALALDDVVIGEQPGLVPSVFTADYNDVIRTNRPFLESTRQVRPPTTGGTMTLPIITGRAVAGTQAGNAEKGALTTTTAKVGTGSFAAKYVFAGADISIQMILRADRSFLDLLDEEFIEAYALDMENKALAALIAGYTDSASVAHTIEDGGTLDPEDPHFGVAWQNSIASTARRAPTHIWMNAAAVGAFIDAKNPTTNGPLYSDLAAAFTAANGPGGRLSGLTPVYVPAMDDEAYDAIVGPASGFVWAEDPAVRLQADAPAVAGRDIVLAGTLFPAPRYADAFTKYTIAS
ncbi:MAG TPA: hypothetical protein VNN79_11465 [Actinomycetota bacterium]|nr:hypothetical protein [Actinomycetota bacterium]